VRIVDLRVTGRKPNVFIVDDVAANPLLSAQQVAGLMTHC
jgi:hypothetical protein